MHIKYKYTLLFYNFFFFLSPIQTKKETHNDISDFTRIVR